MIDEGYIKFESHWRRSNALSDPEIAELIKWRTPRYAAGLIGLFAKINIGYGNISMRVGPNNQFIITGTQTGAYRRVGQRTFRPGDELRSRSK